MKLKKLLASSLVSVAALFGMTGQAKAVIVTDIIMMVDESGSMGNVQANLRNNIGLFASILSAGGIDARYGLVGYGNSQVRPRMLVDLTTPAAFATAAQNLLINGGTEPGYSATAFALNAIDGQSTLFSFRANALKNLILFTDEPSNGDNCNGCQTGGNSTTLADADALLTANNALFNAVLRNTSTIASYQSLYTNHGGNLYDLNGLNTTNQAVVTTFVNAFAASKLQEIQDFCTRNPNDPACQTNGVPEPGTLALLGLSVLGFRLAQRRGLAAR